MEQPKRIGDYEVLGKLGSGGMGEVYRVRNVISDRIEAMKVLLPDLVGRQDLAARFLREIKVLAALHHPNIAALRTALTVDNQLVMIMELVEGQSLSQRLMHGPIASLDAVQFIDQALDALDYAHRRLVIHRDVKPANMMLTPQGHVKLTDFGIARSANDHTLTMAGATTGSLSYMSPEQVNGQTTDARSDLYAVGVSLYEMVTGQLPFKANSDFAVMLAHLNADPRPPIDIQPSLSPELNRIILKAMAKSPVDRFQSADEFRAALKGMAGTVAGQASRTDTAYVATLAIGVAALPPIPAAHAMSPASPTPPIPAIPEISAMPNAPGSHDTPGGLGPRAGAPPSAAVPPARRVQGTVNPLLYVVLGAFLVVAAVAGMAYYSRSAEATPPTTPLPVTASTPAPPAAPAPTPDTPPAEPAAAEAPVTTSPPAATTSTTPAPQPKAATKAAAPGHVKPLRAEPAPAVTSLDQPTAVEPRREGAPNAAADDEAFDNLETELDKLSARAAAVNGTLDRLKQEQARMGYGLRGDMASSQQSMNVSLSKATEAMERKDLARARRFKAQAEGELATLEKFIGR